ncbi:MAG TPA: D-glycero-beta-D-manno-heptose 1-phosphate adenylyltransferase [Acidobacteria bacterium]|nr:D-glycero-beta-D-manno-heptose 1-phosphate adenylyltransferase [Acidobacteriota bacterium]
MTADLAGLVARLTPARIAVIGDVMLDRWVSGRVARVSPEAPIPVLEIQGERSMAGGAANVAAKAAGLGAEVTLAGVVGDDPEGRELARMARASGIATGGLVTDRGRPTTVKTRLIARHQQVLRTDREDRTPLHRATASAMGRAAREAVEGADAVIVEDYGKGALTPGVLREIFETAARRGVPVVVDPCCGDFTRYAGATVLTPNLAEAAAGAGMPVDGDDRLETALRRLVEMTGAAVAVTRDARGISLLRPGAERVEPIPTQAVDVFDVTGAGDAVAAAMALALAAGLDLAEACAVANLAGRAVVQQFGVGELDLARLRREARAVTGPQRKFVDRTTAAARTAQVRAEGGTVVFTNGCFDILHYGHAQLLQEARAQGDFLVVGLNSDDSVRRLKGPGRPLVPEEQRASMLALYPFVDLVVLFDEDTPLELVLALRPDVIVKGGDYRPEDVVGGPEILSWGGRVHIVPLVGDLSTSRIVGRMAEEGS